MTAPSGWDEIVDVVVVGSGGGITGAYTAARGTTYPGGGNPIGASMLFSHLAALHMAGEASFGT